jgi:hypothetical protein
MNINMAGQNGGARPGAGRKKGQLSSKNQEAIERAKASGIMPMDVLLNDMRYFHKLAEEVLAKFDGHATAEENMELFKQAAALKSIARDCASAVSPYIHPKLSSTEAKVEVQNREALLDELE